PQEYARLLGCLVEGNQAWAKSAPVLMLSVAKLNFDRGGKPNAHAWHDVGLAAMSLVVQATALGLWVHQMAGILPDKARELYSIPEGWEAVAGFALGYYGDPKSLPQNLEKRETAPRSRKPLEKFVFTGGWGKPSAIANP
ncbi:MAG: nitroreductase family protein, partial [Candidatus Acidiferrales bacterium]